MAQAVHWYEAMKLRGRGRPRTATEEQRAAGYKDERGRYQLTSGLKPWHERIVDYMMLNPNATRTRAAEYFGVSPQWMGQVMNSDAFKEYYRGRMRGHQDTCSVTIVNQMQGIAETAMQKMQEQLEDKKLPFADVKSAAELAIKSLGYGPSAGGVRVNVNTGGGESKTFIGVSSDVLARARADMEKARKENTKQIEAKPEDFRFVTASMEVSVDEMVEDAVVVGSSDEED